MIQGQGQETKMPIDAFLNRTYFVQKFRSQNNEYIFLKGKDGPLNLWTCHCLIIPALEEKRYRNYAKIHFLKICK